MVELALARLDAIELQIKALEQEYKAIYQLITGADMGRHRNVYGSRKFCEGCGKTLPLSEFYSREKESGIYYLCRCKTCEKLRRNNSQYKKPEAENTIQRKRTPKPKKNFDVINDIQNEAAANGMSYGQWVAQQYIKETKNEKEVAQR